MTISARLFCLAGMLAAGCSFSGASGTPEEPDVDAMPDGSGSGSGSGTGSGSGSGSNTLTCNDFKEIEESRYYVIAESMNKGTALARCAAIPGAHLVTFETTDEITAVVRDYPISTKVWTAVSQKPARYGFGGQTGGWANDIAGARTNLPEEFPWLSGQPDDGNTVPFEDSAENEADLSPNGMFDDAHHSRTDQVLCECDSSESIARPRRPSATAP